jgi:hypothetical protein
MATKYFSVQIPTSTYIKKFIQKRCGNPVAINNNSLLGVVLIAVMDKPKYHVHLKPHEKESCFKSYTDNLACVAPLSLLKDYHFSLTKDQVIQINRYFEQSFKEALYIHCTHRVNHQKRVKGYDDAIFEFAELYKIAIGQDVTFDCLKKMEYRKRKEYQVKIFEDMSATQIAVQQSFFV